MLFRSLAVTTTSVAINGIKAPLAAIPPVAGGVKDVGTAIYHGGEKVVGAVGGAASKVGSTIAGWF